MLLVDDDQAEVLQRGEDRRTRADGEAHAPAAQVAVGGQALAGREPGMQHGDRLADEALAGRAPRSAR